MTRIGCVALALACFAFRGRMDGQTAVAALSTVSIHVDSVETYNAAFRLLTEDFGLPAIYGGLLTPEMGSRRNYAGLWAGNVLLEVCGPYPKEFEAGEARARWHGLTFDPAGSAEKSAAELKRRGITFHGPVQWGGSPAKFVIVDEAALVRPRFAVSIMEPGFDEKRPRMARDVRAVEVGYEDEAALGKWRTVLDRTPWPGSGGPELRFVRAAANRIEAVVVAWQVDAALLDRAKAFGLPIRVSLRQGAADLPSGPTGRRR